MWRMIAGWGLVFSGIAGLGAEMFAIVALEEFLISNPSFTIFRIAIWIALIWLGIRLMKKYREQENDEWE